MLRQEALQRLYERQDLGGRYSTIAIVEARLEHLFPRHQHQEFFKTHRKGFDVYVRLHNQAFDRLGVWSFKF
jgi:hypothetical protein